MIDGEKASHLHSVTRKIPESVDTKADEVINNRLYIIL